MNNVITMTGNKARTPTDVVHELNELVAAGEVKNILVVVTRPNNATDIDWSFQSMKDLSYSTHIVQHNMMLQIDKVLVDE